MLRAGDVSTLLGVCAEVEDLAPEERDLVEALDQWMVKHGKEATE